MGKSTPLIKNQFKKAEVVLGHNYRFKSPKVVKEWLAEHPNDWREDTWVSLSESKEVMPLKKLMNGLAYFDRTHNVPWEILIRTTRKSPDKDTLQQLEDLHKFKYVYFSSVGPGAGEGKKYKIGERAKIYPHWDGQNWTVCIVLEGSKQSPLLYKEDVALLVNGGTHKYSVEVTNITTVHYEWKLWSETPEDYTEYNWERM